MFRISRPPVPLSCSAVEPKSSGAPIPSSVISTIKPGSVRLHVSQIVPVSSKGMGMLYGVDEGFAYEKADGGGLFGGDACFVLEAA